VADAVEKDDAPNPPELVFGWLVERWGADATIGSQIPARLLGRMTTAVNVHAAMTSYRAGMYRLADWARSYPTYLDIVTRIRLMRQEQNA